MENSDAPHGPLTLRLSTDEAVVLFELLARLGESGGRLDNLEEAEVRALWTLEAQLERQLVSFFRPEYGELLAAARARLLGDEAEGE